MTLSPPPLLDRREFLGALAVPLLVHDSQRAALYDLVVKGGHVIDPDQGLSAVRDVAVSGTRIARVAPDIPSSSARRTVAATGLIVTPGLIDVHVHVYDASPAWPRSQMRPR